MRLAIFTAILAVGTAMLASGCLSRPPDTPLHVRPTDGKPRAPGEKKGGLYDTVELKPSQGRRDWKAVEGSHLKFTIGVDDRFFAFAQEPYLRSVLHRQNLIGVVGTIPIEGGFQMDGNRINTATGAFVLRLDQLTLEDDERAAAVKNIVFGIPERGDGQVEARIIDMKFGSGPREGFAIQGDITLELPVGAAQRKITVFMTLDRQSYDRYRWTTYQPVEVKVSEDFASREDVREVGDRWDVRKIADMVRIHAELVLERPPG
ncbi:MAG TPA: hypothetical protein DIU15_07955 [Deltaproteobacteria bacterium]|nr:hypothetical protein [Deltaproteobacteria bacterium]HCP45959.1 hypothetical protein [Deltaproteobacteria bacterium]